MHHHGLTLVLVPKRFVDFIVAPERLKLPTPWFEGNYLKFKCLIFNNKKYKTSTTFS